jgi:hypothetical protein
MRRIEGSPWRMLFSGFPSPVVVGAVIGDLVVEAFVVLDAAPCELDDLPDDRDVLASMRVSGLAVGHPVPALDDLWPRRAEAEDEAPAPRAA